MKVLVTGGAGYIGSHTCKALSLQGHQPVVIDNLVYGHEWAVKWGPCYKADILDSEKVSKIIRDENIEAVIHFAAFAYVGESMLSPAKYYKNNVVGSLSLLEVMRSNKIEKIVFSSTCATYGVPSHMPIQENVVQNPVNPYGRSKLMVEEILRDLARTNTIQATALRYFNAAGADADLDVGEDHDPETHLLPLAIEAAFNNKEIQVYGQDYPTLDGTCIRDYIHVTDLAEAHVLALTAMKGNKSSPSFSAYNLGTGRGSSVLEVIQMVEKVTSRKVKVKICDRRAGDPPELVASSEWAQQQLGWTPTHSSLENIVTTASHWYEKHHLSKKSTI